MKTIFPLILLLFLISTSCHKSDSDEQETPAPSSDTGEYIIFTLNGDSFSNVQFAMTELPKQSGSNFSSSKNNFSLSAPANGYNISGYFTTLLKKAGSVTLDTVNNTSAFILSGNKGNYFIKSTGGQFSITQYPIKVGQYVKGTFSGLYVDVNTQQSFTISKGQFRIQRTL